MSKSSLLSRELNCTLVEAETALEAHNDHIDSARESLRAALEFRRRKFGPALDKAWSRYSKSDKTDYDGTLLLLQDLGVDPNDEVVLAIVYELQAQQVGVFDKVGFVHGWGRLKCASLADMQNEVHQLRAQMASASYFTRVYKNAFKFNLEPGHRLLDFETASAYWELLLKPRYKGIDEWLGFLSAQKTQKVSADTWNMYLEFLEYAKADPWLKDWDENGSWPIVIDDFVAYVKSRVVELD